MPDANFLATHFERFEGHIVASAAVNRRERSGQRLKASALDASRVDTAPCLPLSGGRRTTPQPHPLAGRRKRGCGLHDVSHRAMEPLLPVPVSTWNGACTFGRMLIGARVGNGASGPTSPEMEPPIIEPPGPLPTPVEPPGPKPTPVEVPEPERPPIDPPEPERPPLEPLEPTPPPLRTRLRTQPCPPRMPPVQPHAVYSLAANNSALTSRGPSCEIA